MLSYPRRLRGKKEDTRRVTKDHRRLSSVLWSVWGQDQCPNAHTFTETQKPKPEKRKIQTILEGITGHSRVCLCVLTIYNRVTKLLKSPHYILITSLTAKYSIVVVAAAYNSRYNNGDIYLATC